MVSVYYRSRPPDHYFRSPVRGPPLTNRGHVPESSRQIEHCCYTFARATFMINQSIKTNLYRAMRRKRIRGVADTVYVHYIQYRTVQFLPRDAMHKRDLCCHAVSVRPSVRLSRSWITSKRINISSKFFHHRVATPF